MISDAVRVRVIRALLGISSKEFASRVGVTAGVVTGWEKGRFCPQRRSRQALERICDLNKITFLPSGMPVLFEDAIPAQETT